MKQLTLLLFCLITALASNAQSGRQKPKLYGSNSYKDKGWFFAPGITYTPGVSGNRFETLRGVGDLSNDTIFSGRFDPKGGFGFYAEVGRHHFIENIYLINHIDYGAHFKMLRGSERYVGAVGNAGSLVETTNNASFSESFAGAFFNASNILQITDNAWVHNSIGVNIDYRVISSRSLSGFYGAIPQSFPADLTAQLHYKIGVGFKLDNGLYVLPMIETPILNLYQFERAKSTLPYFSSEYRPLILTIRVMFLDKTADRKCVGKDTGKNKPKLWGDEMKKYNK